MPQLATTDLTITLGGTDFTFEVSEVTIDGEKADAGFLSFGDAKLGGKRIYRLKGTAAQDTTVGSIADRIWSAAGTTIAVVVRLAGGTGAASASQPTLTGNVTIEEPDGTIWGGEADDDKTARFEIEFDFPYTAKPVLARA